MASEKLRNCGQWSGLQGIAWARVKETGMKHLLLALLLSTAAGARPLQAMFWNLESPGHGDAADTKPTADIDFLCGRIGQDFGSADVVGFAEVEPEWAPALRAALEDAADEPFGLALSPVGGHDRLAVAWRLSRFRATEAPSSIEAVAGPFAVGSRLSFFRPSWTVPLQDLRSGQRLTVTVNHLARSGPDSGPRLRRTQAHLLRGWLQSHPEPVISLGDFNFDFDVKDGDREQSGYSVLTEGDVFHWVRPADPLVPTEGESRDGHPFFKFNSILDFVFASNGARDWPARGEILTRPDDFGPPELNSDHRPVRATFEVEP